MERWSLAARETWVVGDRMHDVRGARANGVECVGVLWGYGSAEELQQAGAEHLVASYGDGLPHDLAHLVVESAFGLRGGFWGRVDDGADPQAINAEANGKGGRDKTGCGEREPLSAAWPAGGRP